MSHSIMLNEENNWNPFLVPQLAVPLLRKVFGKADGIGIGTQPLSIIMKEKIETSPIPTALLTMKGRMKSKDEICEDAQLSSSLDYVLEGKYRILLGHVFIFVWS